MIISLIIFLLFFIITPLSLLYLMTVCYCIKYRKNLENMYDFHNSHSLKEMGVFLCLNAFVITTVIYLKCSSFQILEIKEMLFGLLLIIGVVPTVIFYYLSSFLTFFNNISKRNFKNIYKGDIEYITSLPFSPTIKINGTTQDSLKKKIVTEFNNNQLFESYKFNGYNESFYGLWIAINSSKYFVKVKNNEILSSPVRIENLVYIKKELSLIKVILNFLKLDGMSNYKIVSHPHIIDNVLFLSSEGTFIEIEKFLTYFDIEDVDKLEITQEHLLMLDIINI